jgi:hypothetical protein
LSLQGGSATTGNTNGGNLLLSGGTASGTGANGLVVMTTPTFSTTTNDPNCYTGGAAVATSCTVAASSVNNSSAILIGFSQNGQTATLPDPTIATAFLQALKINWGNRTGGFFKKLLAGSDVPYINNNSFAQELSNLTFNELLELTKVGQIPAVATQAQINQVASQVTSPSPSSGNPPQTTSGGSPNTSSSKVDVDMQAVIDKLGGPQKLIDFMQRNGLDRADASTVAKAFAAVVAPTPANP